jgi:hypothetical protein
MSSIEKLNDYVWLKIGIKLFRNQCPAVVMDHEKRILILQFVSFEAKSRSILVRVLLVAKILAMKIQTNRMIGRQEQPFHKSLG